jgi:hypothetical protein
MCSMDPDQPSNYTESEGFGELMAAMSWAEEARRDGSVG